MLGAQESLSTSARRRVPSVTPAHPGQAMLSGPGIPLPQPCPEPICPQGSHTHVAVQCLTRLWSQVQRGPWAKKSQGWSSEWTGWISLQSKGLSRAFSYTTVQKHQFFGAQPSSQSNSPIHTWPQEKYAYQYAKLTVIFKTAFHSLSRRLTI